MRLSQALKVLAGSPISAASWEAMRIAVTALHLLPGPGIRLRFIPGIGTIISTIRTWFAHPWQVSMLGDGGARIRTGLINGVMPTIDGTPLDGGNKGTKPTLKWDKLKVDKDGLGWIAVEITCGKDWEVKSAKMVQVATLDTEDGKPPEKGAAPGYSAGGIPGLKDRRARYPIAMLRQRKGRLSFFQIPFFNLQHRASVRDEKTDVARHFFW